jgi:predicted TIM-barrel fold metal-dependent hydrolase/NADPH-dependent 2,4-dienoyl-CoA reductase/sulfur reductase-like enzyme
VNNQDLLIVGAGPAGLGAAVEAARHGLSVMLLDENASPGGRIWQALETRGAKDPEDAAALALIQRFRAGATQAHYGATVWAIEPDGQVFWSDAEGAHCVSAGSVLLATGTTERPMPIPGWTLPGVMTVGAAQIALKTGGLLPDSGTWLAGQGPLLLLYANQVLDAGGRIGGVIDLSDGFAPVRALRHVNLATLSDVRRGLGWRRRLSRAGVRWIAATELRARGEASLDAVSFRTSIGWQTERTNLLLLHDGVIPSVQITRALGCAHRWSDTQRCWHPVTDDIGRTSVPNVLIAGDGAGIGGAQSALLSGRIAVAGLVGADVTALQAERAKALAARPLLDALFAPRPMRLDDSTLVCRCEEVTAGAVREAALTGCQGMNQLKAYTRCGMGPCQGRMCGSVAIEVLAEARNVPVSAIEPLRTRFPTKPIPVGDLVTLLTQSRNVPVSTTTANNSAFLPVRDDWLARRTEAVLEPDLPIVDPHHHLWQRAGWNYMLDDLLADINTGHNIVATVFLQCHSMHRAAGPEAFRPVGETEFVNGVAAMSASGGYGPAKICAGIVGHVDLRNGAGSRAVLEAHIRAGGGRFRGIRHITSNDPDPTVMNPAFMSPPGVMGEDSFREGFACLSPLNLSFDAWLYHTQLGELTALAKAFPGTQICLNHIGGPIGIGAYAGKRAEVFSAWSKAIKSLAACPNVVVKLGGMAMRINGWDFHTKVEPPSSQELAATWKPYVETCIEAFGAARCMFESNFPVDKGSYSYPVFWNACKTLAKAASATEKTALFSGTAARFYRLNI